MYFYPRVPTCHEYNYLKTLTLTRVPTWHEQIITQTRTQAARELLVRRAILLTQPLLHYEFKNNLFRGDYDVRCSRKRRYDFSFYFL